MLDSMHETTDDSILNVKLQRKHFYRQLLICSGVWTCYFQSGLCFGAPTVFIPQIRKTDAQISDETASWLTSAYNLGGLPWIVALPLIARICGRKPCFIFVCLNTLMGFIIFYCSKEVAHLMISQALQGVVNASTVTLSLMIVTEYTSPCYRGVFLTLKTATFVWGMWISNAIGTFLHWRFIGLLGIICSIYALLTVTLWPESPYWLGAKGRFDECAGAHHWLKGSSKESNKELDSIINYQDIKLSASKSLHLSLTRPIKQITSKQFIKPVLLSMLILAQYNLSGKLICSVYSLEIIKKITGSESTAYIAMLVLDGITVFGTYSGCILSKLLKRRTLLLITSSLGIVFLFLISFYLYLVKLSFIIEDKYVSIPLLIGFSLSISCGPMILATSLCGELLPLRSRTLTIILIGSTGNLMLGILVKISPYIFNICQLHGAFLFYGISTSICTVLIYKYLPETKDKTIQEIDDCMKGIMKPKEIELLCK